MENVKTNKNYLNDVNTLVYSTESELVLLKGKIALLDEYYDRGKISITRYEMRKREIEKEIEVLSCIECV